MVSHSFHTHHQFLILIIQVPNVSFAIESFVTYKKVLMLHIKRVFLLLKFKFFILLCGQFIANYVMKSSAKIGLKNVTKILKKHPERINYRPDTLLPKPLCITDSEISDCFLIQILLL